MNPAKNCIYSVERKKKREMDKNKEGEREKDGRSEATLKTLLRIAARHERIGGERESACWRRSGSTVTGGRRLGTTQRAKRGWWSEEEEEKEEEEEEERENSRLTVAACGAADRPGVAVRRGVT